MVKSRNSRRGDYDKLSSLELQIKNPSIYEKLRADIDAHIPYDVDVPTMDQVQLPYLDMVLKETLRFSSPGFGTFRECPVDTEVSGVKLPAKTTLALWNPAGKLIPSIVIVSRSTNLNEFGR